MRPPTAKSCARQLHWMAVFSHPASIAITNPAAPKSVNSATGYAAHWATASRDYEAPLHRDRLPEELRDHG